MSNYILCQQKKKKCGFFFIVWRRTLMSPGSRQTVGPNVKNPPKTRFKKFVKLNSYTYAYNSLTNVEHKTHPGNGNRPKFAVICLEILVKSHQENLFWAGISHLKPLCSMSAQADGKHWGQFIYGFAFEIFNVKNFHQNHSCTAK